MNNGDSTDRKWIASRDAYAHWVQPNGEPYDRQSMREEAARTLKELRWQYKPIWLPQDGSSGQYDAWTDTLVRSILEED